MAQSMILETLTRAAEIKPIAEVNGVKVVSFEDAAVLANAEGYEPTPDTGLRTFNPDGTLARTRKLTSAINPDVYFDNRYKLKGKLGKEMWIVSAFTPSGYRAITEQARGQIFLKNIPCHVLVRDETTKELKVDRVENVSDAEFVSDFTNKLSNELMARVQKVISEFGAELTAHKTMPI